MTDFSQNGEISTLHNIVERPLSELENELNVYANRRPMSLLLPTPFVAFGHQALANILRELQQVSYLSEIVVGLDQADRDQFRHALNCLASLPQRRRVIWNDGPRLRKIDELLVGVGLAPPEDGQVRAVWYGLGYILAAGKAETVAMHGSDVFDYHRGLLAKLLYPVANPAFTYEFCKGYYAQVNGGHFAGRAGRLLLAPLVNALIQVFGATDYLKYLSSFHYPLSREIAFRRDVIHDLRIPDNDGLELGILSEVQRHLARNRICQMDVAPGYGRVHQCVTDGVDVMDLGDRSVDVIRTLFEHLTRQGLVMDSFTVQTIKVTYQRIALDFIEAYHSDSIVNGLVFDVHSEEKAVDFFATNIYQAGRSMAEGPVSAAYLPSWSRVISAIPDILSRLYDAVESDNREFDTSSIFVTRAPNNLPAASV
ncbi:MAG: glycosyl transferase [Cellvibrionaceae bacterium]